jgi:nucleotide-binding universal stress UspA family protein
LPGELLEKLHLEPGDITGTILEQATGDAAAAILEEVSAHHTRLIVMSTHGWKPDAERPLGHVAEEMLLKASCSLLLLRAEIAERFSQEGRGLTRILIPLDGTPTTAAALAPAAELASRSGAFLDVLHVATSMQAKSEPGSMTVPQYQDNPYHEWTAWRKEFGARFLGQFEGQAANLEVAVGDPSQEILRAAHEHESDLIVLVWKGRLAADRAQTVRAMLREAPCPLLFLHARPSLDLPSGIIDVRVPRVAQI